MREHSRPHSSRHDHDVLGSAVGGPERTQREKVDTPDKNQNNTIRDNALRAFRRPLVAGENLDGVAAKLADAVQREPARGPRRDERLLARWSGARAQLTTTLAATLAALALRVQHACVVRRADGGRGVLVEFRGPLHLAGAVKPSFNVAPTQAVPVLGQRDGARVLRTMRWGLIPSWAKDAKIGAQCINARAETEHEKPAFRGAFKHRRCAVIATGWYEWRTEVGVKMPHWFHAADGRSLALAGLWELWVDKATGAEVRSCTIVTTEPNARAAAVHDRMPVVLDDAGLTRWLAPTGRDQGVEAHELGALRELLVACPDDVLDVWPVDRRVGSSKNNDARCIERVGAERAA